MVLLILSLLVWIAAAVAQDNGVLGQPSGATPNKTISSSGIAAIALTVVAFSVLAAWLIPWRKLPWRNLLCSRGKRYRSVEVEAEEGAPLQEVQSRAFVPEWTPSPPHSEAHSEELVQEAARPALNAGLGSQESLSSEDSQDTVRPQESEPDHVLYDPAKDPLFPDEDGKNGSHRHHGPSRFNVGALLGAGV
ncbi:hypothetical protein CALCODRAFT_521345 [Calocera cornea HHB12733]|uniref:Uncharacterized protein n=1 Tax=Calocera cornea HHB12733 TaxID=1353952 RepID=A0A165CVH8_9BASI|nr:hypothetical protein CALCODRAFT_521345 [Calocera cornea HHB12733]